MNNSCRKKDGRRILKNSEDDGSRWQCPQFSWKQSLNLGPIIWGSTICHGEGVEAITILSRFLCRGHFKKTRFKQWLLFSNRLLWFLFPRQCDLWSVGITLYMASVCILAATKNSHRGGCSAGVSRCFRCHSKVWNLGTRERYTWLKMRCKTVGSSDYRISESVWNIVTCYNHCCLVVAWEILGT